MKQMKLNEFKDELLDYMRNEHPEMEWQLNEVNKVNEGSLTAIVGRMEGQTIAPCLYIEPYFEHYVQEDMTFSAIATVIDFKYQDIQKENVKFNVNDLMDFEKIKDKIIAQLINRNSNVQLLDKCPHTNAAGDMAVIYRVAVGVYQEGMSSILINNNMLKGWNQSAESLHELAIENTPRLCPIKIQKLTDTILDLMKSDSLG